MVRSYSVITPQDVQNTAHFDSKDHMCSSNATSTYNRAAGLANNLPHAQDVITLPLPPCNSLYPPACGCPNIKTLPFHEQQNLNDITYEDQTIIPNIVAVTNSFKVSEGCWTYDRRHYFAVEASFSLSGLSNSNLHLAYHDKKPIIGFAMQLHVEGNPQGCKDSLDIIVQQRPNRGEGSTLDLKKISVHPRWLLNDGRRLEGSEADIAIWEYLQLRVKTSRGNVGRRHPQQYANLVIRLLAQVAETEGNDSWICVAQRVSVQLLLRSRSCPPNHSYNEGHIAQAPPPPPPPLVPPEVPWCKPPTLDDTAWISGPNNGNLRRLCANPGQWNEDAGVKRVYSSDAEVNELECSWKTPLSEAMGSFSTSPHDPPCNNPKHQDWYKEWQYEKDQAARYRELYTNQFDDAQNALAERKALTEERNRVTEERDKLRESNNRHLADAAKASEKAHSLEVSYDRLQREYSGALPSY